MATNGESIPKAREQGLVVRELVDEVLVYDLETHKAHCLSRAAAAIWQRCDGKTTVRGIADGVGRDLGSRLDEEAVWVAVKRLGRARLLERPVGKARITALPRRELLRRVAAIGGLAVLSITAPTPAQATTCIDCKTCELTKQVKGVCPAQPCCNGANAGTMCVATGNKTCCTCGGTVVCGGTC